MKRVAYLHKGLFENGKLGSGVGETGYGRMGDEIHRALMRLGYEVEVADGGGRILGADGQPVGDMASDKGTVPSTVLFNQLPGHAWGWWEGQHSIISTMFETDTVPAEFADVIHEYETVVVPCHANKRAFDKIHDNVHVVPLGVDARWHYAERRPFGPTRPFTFLTAGAGWHRKGFDLTTRAFLEVRDAHPGINMQLIVKAQNDLVWDTQPEDSDIFFVKERLTREDEVDLYASAHCYVSASRGEGWGLCPHQAIAQGCPTILGNAGGQAEFARWGLPVECHDVPADYGIWQDTGNWWEPDYDQLVARMDEVVTDYDRVREEAKRNADGIAHLTWENTARQLAALFSTDPPVEPTEWHTFKRKLYPIEVTKDMRCDVGGLVYSFTPGITYFEFADVKRILYMSGVLHPDCPSEGLLPDQITERAQAVETECPHCHRPYPSVTELADEVAAELAALGIGQA